MGSGSGKFSLFADPAQAGGGAAGGVEGEVGRLAGRLHAQFFDGRSGSTPIEKRIAGQVEEESIFLSRFRWDRLPDAAGLLTIQIEAAIPVRNAVTGRGVDFHTAAPDGPT
jgi:hypothetical protein